MREKPVGAPTPDVAIDYPSRPLVQWDIHDNWATSALFPGGRAGADSQNRRTQRLNCHDGYA
jgi:hypothetical protein